MGGQRGTQSSVQRNVKHGILGSNSINHSDDGFISLNRRNKSSRIIFGSFPASYSLSARNRGANSPCNAKTRSSSASQLYANKFTVLDYDANEEIRFVPQDTDYRIRTQVREELLRKEKYWRSTKTRLETRMQKDMERRWT